jgi:hypothetical protein
LTVRSRLGFVLVCALVALLGVGDVPRAGLQHTLEYRSESLQPWASKLSKLLQRRTEAVVHRDEAAFLADVDKDPDARRRERDKYRNLVALDVSTFACRCQR